MSSDINALLADLFDDARNPSSQPLYRYALADAAQDKRLPSALQGSMSRGLLGNSESVRASTPHLVALPSESDATDTWQWIARNATKTPCLIIFTSTCDFEMLFTHLSAFLDVKVNKSTTMLLAFWDPMILATLLGQPTDKTLHVQGPVFNTSQRAAFLEVFHAIKYWDRQGHIQHIEPETLPEQSPTLEPEEDGPILPLVFNPEQVRKLVEAGLPDLVLYELRLNRPGVLLDRTDWENYSLTCRLIDAAHDLNIRGLRDLVNFVGAGMILGENYHRYPAIAKELVTVSEGKESFTDMLERLPGEVLEQASLSATPNPE